MPKDYDMEKMIFSLPAFGDSAQTAERPAHASPLQTPPDFGIPLFQRQGMMAAFYFPLP
jgi:hypothetical protein